MLTRTSTNKNLHQQPHKMTRVIAAINFHVTTPHEVCTNTCSNSCTRCG